MKRNHIFSSVLCSALLLGGAALTGCDDKLDTTQNGVVSTSSFYQDDADCEEAITQVYYQNSVMIHDYYRSNPWDVKTLLSDEIYHGGGTREDGLEDRVINEYQFDYANQTIEYTYSGLYKLIYTANLVINNFGEGTTTVQKKAVAEAKVFRAWANFQLVTLWGNAPIVTEAVRDDYKAPNSSSEELWAQVEKDLQEAISSGLLGQKTEMDDRVTGIRVTKQYAQALLGKAYVFQEKYTQAVSILDEVVNSRLYGFLDNYADYALADQNNNREVLFGDNPTDDQNAAFGIFPDVFFAPSGNFWGNIFFTDMSMVGFGWFHPSQHIVDQFLKYEPESNRFHQTLKSYPDLAAQGLQFNAEIHGFCGYFNWKCRGSSQSLMSGSLFYYWNQFPQMKYSEVVLLDAEAKIMSQGAGAGDDLINLIRDKAGVPHVSGAGMTELKLEKELECWLDGCRFDDLVRWGDAPSVLKDQGKQIPSFCGLNDDGSLNVNATRYTNPEYGFKAGKHDLLPYPQKELDVNPNIVQNPGW